jgi:hypothetical protein
LSVLHKQGGTTVIDGATYTLDNAGNRTAKTNHLTGTEESYTYDAIYQLTQVQQQVNGTPTTTESYIYDNVGNRTSSLNIPNYTVNESNQLTSTTDSLVRLVCRKVPSTIVRTIMLASAGDSMLGPEVVQSAGCPEWDRFVDVLLRPLLN